MNAQKKLLSIADVDAQAALELPDRQTFCGAFIVRIIRDVEVLNIDSTISHNEVEVVTVETGDINVAANLCGTVALVFKCYVYQKQW